MTCAGPLEGEKPGSACPAAPDGTIPNSVKASVSISTTGVAVFQALGAASTRRSQRVIRRIGVLLHDLSSIEDRAGLPHNPRLHLGSIKRVACGSVVTWTPVARRRQ